ncbi:MAG: GNAT family N-acetyltransferase [Gammaproteobacteria bacterium]|nr:GNAT family N-acetyltransferase [Gammaproteobacteria bacterium]
MVIDARKARFELRPLRADDAMRVAALSADSAIADAMVNSPPPAPVSEVRRFVEACQRGEQVGSSVYRAIVDADELVGVVALHPIDSVNRSAELMVWVGRAFWGRGLASKAVNSMVRDAFECHGLNRIYAYHLWRSKAPARVLAAAGFVREGVLRQARLRKGGFEDVVQCALLHEDWRSSFL